MLSCYFFSSESVVVDAPLTVLKSYEGCTATSYGPRYGGGAGTGIRSGRSSKQSKAQSTKNLTLLQKRFVDAIRYRDLGAAADVRVLLHLAGPKQRRPVHGDRVR